MAIQTVCILGGTGFVGRHIARLLCEQGIAVCIPTRNPDRARQAFTSVSVSLVPADVHDVVQLANLFVGKNAVINLVGILHEQGGQTFQRAHVALPHKVIEAAKSAGVRRLLHMSALNAAPGASSVYLCTKGEAEIAVLGSGLQTTVFRPSVIFGAGDSFLTLFAKLAKWAPVLPLARANARFQPVWVEDVAQAFVHSLKDNTCLGQRYDLCGPRIYSLRELVGYAAACKDRYPLIVPLPDALAYLQANLMEWLPVKLMTRDNFHSMQQDNVCDCEYPFGIIPACLEDIAPQYLT